MFTQAHFARWSRLALRTNVLKSQGLRSHDHRASTRGQLLAGYGAPGSSIGPESCRRSHYPPALPPDPDEYQGE